MVACSDVVSDGGAAVQSIVAAAVLARLSLRRQAWAWSVGVLGVGAALFGAIVWVVLGDANALRQVRQILLGVVFAVATAVVCGWPPEWALHDGGDLDLARVRRLLWTVAWVAAALGSVSGLAMLAADPVGAVRRLADLVLSWACSAASSLSSACWWWSVNSAGRQPRR